MFGKRKPEVRESSKRLEGEEMQGAEGIIGNIADQVKESQLKLGFADETIRLYYLASSMALLCGRSTDDADAAELAGTLASHPGLQGTPLGALGFEAVAGNRVCVTVPPEGARWVHEQLPDPPFLAAIVDLFGHGGPCPREDVEALFARFGSFIVRDMPADAGFDYTARFADPGVDPYLYCFKDEMGHTIYHRFTEGDFRLRWPEAIL